MNLQEIYDHTTVAVLNQGRQATGGASGGCRLRGRHGSKCIIGWCIADEDYKEEMEPDAGLYDYKKMSGYDHEDEQEDTDDAIDSFTHREIGAAVVKTVGEIDREKFEFLIKLQTAHDDNYYMADMRKEFHEIGSNFGLDTSKVDAFADELENA